MEGLDGDLYAAIDRAADRLDRAVAREIERRREMRLLPETGGRRRHCSDEPGEDDPALGRAVGGPGGLGGMLGPGYLYFFTGFAVLVNLGAYFFSDRIVLAMHQAREVAPEDAPRLHAGRFGPPRTAPGASLVVSVTD